MNEAQLQTDLASLPLGGLHSYNSIGSTNDEALTWASRGAPDLSLVVADEQTAGRGRAGSKWLTPPGTALALSLILRPSAADIANASRIPGLGALAIAEACLRLGLKPAIKWPNDVLLNGSKVAGVLVESVWTGDQLEASVVGLGINVLRGSIPHPAEISFPATSIESELGHPAERIAVLKAVLAALVNWRERIGTDEFLRAWEGLLAFRGQKVTLTSPDAEPITGTLLGLANDGSARLEVNHQTRIIPSGEIHLRPTNAGLA